jgi:hypothetical protein
LQAAPGQWPGPSPGTNSPPDCLCPGSAYRIGLGPRAGQKVLSLRTVHGRDEKNTRALCADAHGFSLHAGVRCGEHQRQRLERLCRYITRPAIAFERLKRDGAGNVVLQLKSAWRDGTRTSVGEAVAASKPTAYGRLVLRAFDRMKAVGPWRFGPKLSDRHFRR